MDTQAPETGPEAILHALRQLSADSIEAKAREDIRSGKKSARNNAVKRLHIVQGLRRNNLEPADFMITKVPVIPPKFRPFAAQGNTFIPGDANVLYQDLFDVRDAHREETKVFGRKNAGTSRLALYDAVRAVYGYGNPVKAKTASKEVSGFLKKIVGRTAKLSFVQHKMMAKTQDNVGRSTVIVDPEYDMDEIGIPKDVAFKMYAPYIQRRLRQLGFSDMDAMRHVRDRTADAEHALERVMEDRPVWYSRAPQWHAHSVNAGRPRLIDGDAIAVNTYVAAGMGMDHDGDQINVHVPASDEAVEECRNKLMTSKNLFSNRTEGRVVHLPKQEQILGLYDAATSAPTKPIEFPSQQAAMDAIRRGQISLSADVTWPGAEA